ncbi:alpha/beta hydrolase [Polaromonas sp.]|uniref:alpha/beta hydrolase n=1 Tax=Polaromonas sp. TaxID=1869339 RepID=UPI0037505906
MFDMSLLGDALLGRLSFRPGAAPDKPALPAGRHHLGIAQERDAVLIVPENLPAGGPVPLLVMFHGAGGSADKVLPFVIEHARQRGFLLLLPQSQFPTWDLVIGGNGPDLERLEQALRELASRFFVDPAHLGFAGFSDGGSYALSAGVTNGDVASHVMVFSGGFMSVFQQNGSPRLFIAHGLEDEQLPIETSARPHVAKLKAAGYDVTAVEFKGPHHIAPPVVALAMDFFLPRVLT